MPKFTYLVGNRAVWLFKEHENPSPILQVKKLRQTEDTLHSSSAQMGPQNSGILAHRPCILLL